MEERVVNLSQFLASRASEVASMQNILESKYLNTTKHPYQVLHKHLKRRAMSHNRYRIPSRLRKQMNVQALADAEKKQKIAKCRKHLRKNKARLFQMRSHKVCWMETHIHQATRMKMIDYAGFKVPEKACEKNFRAVHRYIDHGACIFDASYYHVVEGELPQGLVIDGKTLIHPTDLSDTDLVTHKNRFCIFQILGNRALEAVNTLLQRFDCRVDAARPYYFKLRLPGLKIQCKAAPRYREIRSFCSYDENFSALQQVVEANVEEDLEKSVWAPPEKNAEQKRYSIIQRSRYTHKRKLKRQFQQEEELRRKGKQAQQPKEPPPQTEQGQSKDLQAPIQNLDPEKKKKALRWLLAEQAKFEDEPMQLEEKEAIEVEVPKIELKECIASLLVIPPSSKARTQIDLGFKVVVNLGNGIRIWKLFHQQNLKPIGLRDIKQLCLDRLVPFQDYDQTDPYQEFLATQHKPDYWRLQFPYPFQSDWTLHTNWSYCKLVAFQGIPEKYAIIVRPTEADMELFLKGERKLPCEKGPELQEKRRIATRIELVKYELELAAIKLARELLGYVLFGNNSLEHGTGVGQGKITSQLSGKELFALFRNRNSDCYYFASCIVL